MGREAVNLALLLVDLQEDFLRAPGLEPAAGQIVERAVALLDGCRALAIPVLHIHTTVRTGDDHRMPHWKRAGLWMCVAGTPGHAPPEPLRPVGESVVEKTFFSAFGSGELDARLKALGCDTVIVAGVHLHACVRATVLDAYERGYQVLVAEDAVGSDDPPHAAVSRRYLAARAARFLSVDALLRMAANIAPPAPLAETTLPAICAADGPVCVETPGILEHASPRRVRAPHLGIPVCGREQVALATTDAERAWVGWSRAFASERARVVGRLADLIEAVADELAFRIVLDVGKPLTEARAEVARSAALARAVAARGADDREVVCGPGSIARRRPLGVVAAVTPWNNPLAIPVGKIAPALVYGNTVVLKPSPAGSFLAVRLYELLGEAGCPPGAFNVVCGAASTAADLMADARVDAVTITGSPLAGQAAWEICARRHVPFQAELGGNNAAIVWADCDLEQAAAGITEGAFGFAGQRCTANRRAVVDRRCLEAFLALLQDRTTGLSVGDPVRGDVVVGPVIDETARRRVGALVERTRRAAGEVIAPRAQEPDFVALAAEGAYFPPTIVLGADARSEIVQNETFGPVLVVQEARNFEHALELTNGVGQGLVASLFSRSNEMREAFCDGVRAGILKINQPTHGAGVEAPFGGWKASGVGPPEHGECNREFYTRAQAIYKEL